MLVVDHGQTITGLAPSTTYFCQLRSTDSAGNEALNAGQSFTTTAPRTTPPVFTNVRVSDLQPDQATFAWTTDEPADSQVEFGTTAAYGSASARDPNQVTSHFLLVTGLAPSTTYHYRVNGTDPYGNSGSSTDFTFTTPGVAPPIVVDKTVFKDGKGVQTTAPFSTVLPGELLVAFVASDGPRSGPQSTAVTGAGLTWTLMRRTNSQTGHGRGVAGRRAHSADQRHRDLDPVERRLRPVAHRGGVPGCGGRRGLGQRQRRLRHRPTVTFSATRFGSLVYGVGNDWDRARGPHAGRRPVARAPVGGHRLG